MDGMADKVRAHYTGDAGSNAADRVRDLLETLGLGRVPPERLAALDHFHVRGAEATAELAKLAEVQASWTVLDAGSGLGGLSRYLTERYGCRVEGVDLTPAFVEGAKLLSEQAEVADRLTTRWVMSPRFRLKRPASILSGRTRRDEHRRPAQAVSRASPRAQTRRALGVL